MFEPTRAVVLMQQRLPRRGTAAGPGAQDFQGDVDTAVGIVRAPHLALPAGAQPFVQYVAALQSPPKVGCRSFVHGPRPVLSRVAEPA